ncbi:MAG: hypothetical protein Q9180_006119, partial [Flavoplaca navasiana]
MPAKLRQTNLLSRGDDGSILSNTHVRYGDIEDQLALRSASNIHLGDENGNIREDTITIEEMRSLSQTTRDALFQVWQELQFMISRYESELSHRWLRKSPIQRRKLLLAIWPEMPLVHRPDMAALREADRLGSKSEIRPGFAMRFPYLNLEDLSKQQPLLWMMDSRSRNFPSVFSNADWSSIRLGLKTKQIIPHYMRGYTMYLSGQWTQADYGHLISWEEDRTSIMKCHQGIAPDPGMGLTILEIQREILRFLVRCSVAIMQGALSDEFARVSKENFSCSSIAPILLQQDDRMSPNTVIIDYQSETARTLETPYRAPEAFDFGRLRSLVDAKYHETQDAVFLMREDPGFFAEMIHESCGDTNEALAYRKYEPTFLSLSKGSRHEAISQALMQVYQHAFLWETVHHLLDDLILAYEQWEHRIQLGELFPQCFMEAMSRLEYCLDDAVSGWIAKLPWYMAAAPAFKQQITFSMLQDGKCQASLRKTP